MYTLRIEQLRLPRRRHYSHGRIWREWCFVRAVLRNFRWRLALIFGVLVVGALLFLGFSDPERQLTPLRAVYYTFSLIFGQPPEAFPASPVLQALYFIVPILGLTIIIEAIVDFAFMLRDRRRSEQTWCRTMAHSLSNHIILVGFGRLGYRTYRLLRRLGEPVVVIESNEQNEFLDELRREGAPLLVGDARRESFLVDANIAAARSIILATNDDLANLEIALDARRLMPGIRVVLRMFDQNIADKIRDGFNIHIAMSQSALSAPIFALAAIERAIVGSFAVDDQLVVMLRWPVAAGGPLVGKTIAEVMSQRDVGVVRLRTRAGRSILFPAQSTKLEAGDELLVQAAYEALGALQQQVAAIGPATRP